MAASPGETDEHPAEFPVRGERTTEEQIRPGSSPDPSAILDGEEAAGVFRELYQKARRLVALELDLAETRRQLAENNLKLTEASLELAERQIEELKAENESLRREVEGLRVARGQA